MSLNASASIKQLAHDQNALFERIFFSARTIKCDHRREANVLHKKKKKQTKCERKSNSMRKKLF